MQLNALDPAAPKVTTRLSINSDLLREAKERRIDLSQTLEMYLAELLGEETQQVAIGTGEDNSRQRGVACLFSNGWSNF